MPIRAAFGGGSLRAYGINAGVKRKIGANVSVQYLIVAGGGGSMQNYAGVGGGGGAGGLKTGIADTSGGVRMQIIVGAGAVWPTNGGNSSVTVTEGVWSNISCWGGGSGGGDASLYGPTSDARPGGSGGGSRAFNGLNPGVGTGAAGTPGQGNNGGDGLGFSTVVASGGGGGAGGAGGNGDNSYPNGRGGNGGAAYASAITGTPVNYAGGGVGVGGGQNGTTASPGGGAEQNGSLGGGAGGVGSGTYTGGGGIVILRSIARASNTYGSPTETQVGEDWVYQFTGSGEIVIGTV